MDWILSTIIFIIVLFVYIHVANHLSTSSDLEVYDVVNIPSDKLEDLCGAKQPFIAKNNNNPPMTITCDRYTCDNKVNVFIYNETIFTTISVI